MRIDIEQSPEDEQFYVRYEGDNGQAFATSEGYPDDDVALGSVRDFFASAGKNGFIRDGVVGFDMEITVTDKDGNKRNIHDG